MIEDFGPWQEALIRLVSRVTFGLVFGVGLALIVSLKPVQVALGGCMAACVLPEVFGLVGIGDDMEMVFIDDEDDDTPIDHAEKDLT